MERRAVSVIRYNTEKAQALSFTWVGFPSRNIRIVKHGGADGGGDPITCPMKSAIGRKCLCRGAAAGTPVKAAAHPAGTLQARGAPDRGRCGTRAPPRSRRSSRRR